ncbi:unnamed protein product [Amaranthus hypochondriacus]
MSNQDQRFQHRWEFRRAEHDVDSSSDDQHSRPSSINEPKLMNKFSEDNTKQAMLSPTSFPRVEKENHSSFEECTRKPNTQSKVNERKTRSRINKQTECNQEPSEAAASTDMKGYMDSLVEEIRSTRKDLLIWMTNEIKSSKDNITTFKPSGTRNVKRQIVKTRKPPRKNPNNGKRRRSGRAITKNREDESSDREPPTTNEVVAQTNIVENIVTDAVSVEKVEKQKGKSSRVSNKKQKIDSSKTEDQTDKAVTGTANSCVTLPTVVSQKQVENSGRNPFEDSSVGIRTELNSYQQSFDPRAKQKDPVFAQNGMRDVSDYEQNTWASLGNSNGNGNGNGFSFQPSNGGIGMQNIPNHFGLQYLTQGNSRISGMFREPPGFSNGNHAFMETYGALNQHMKFNVQQGGVMGLQCPDIRMAAFNQGNMASK